MSFHSTWCLHYGQLRHRTPCVAYWSIGSVSVHQSSHLQRSHSKCFEYGYVLSCHLQQRRWHSQYWHVSDSALCCQQCCDLDYQWICHPTILQHSHLFQAPHSHNVLPTQRMWPTSKQWFHHDRPSGDFFSFFIVFFYDAPTQIAPMSLYSP